VDRGGAVGTEVGGIDQLESEQWVLLWERTGWLDVKDGLDIISNTYYE
jgi:hypothetical protein